MCSVFVVMIDEIDLTANLDNNVQSYKMELKKKKLNGIDDFIKF